LIATPEVDAVATGAANAEESRPALEDRRIRQRTPELRVGRLLALCAEMNADRGQHHHRTGRHCFQSMLNVHPYLRSLWNKFPLR
jgi:hypothetical protein